MIIYDITIIFAAIPNIDLSSYNYIRTEYCTKIKVCQAVEYANKQHRFERGPKKEKDMAETMEATKRTEISAFEQDRPYFVMPKKTPSFRTGMKLA